MTPLYGLAAEAAVWTALVPLELVHGTSESLAARLGRELPSRYLQAGPAPSPKAKP